MVSQFRFRSQDGKFRNLHHRGAVQAHPVVSKSLRARAASVGAKIKPQAKGGAVALVFKDHESALKEYSKMVSEGYHCMQDDIPGVLFVISEPKTQQVNESAIQHLPSVPVRGSLAERIANHLVSCGVLVESKVGDLAAKVIRHHGIHFDGSPSKLVNGIAAAHHIDPQLVPQVLHAAFSEGGYAPSYHDQWKEHTSRKLQDYASGEKFRHEQFENATDNVRVYHKIASHKKAEALLAYDPMQAHGYIPDKEDEPLPSQEAINKYKDAVLSPNGEYRHHGHNPSMVALALLHKKIVNYRPDNFNSWHSVSGKDDYRQYTNRKFHDGSTVTEHSEPDFLDSVKWKTRDYLLLARQRLDRLEADKGPGVPHDAEHTDKHGTKYRAYTLDTPEKANAGCWGNRFCIATGSHGQRMNKAYHGGDYSEKKTGTDEDGTYHTTHLITKVTRGPDGEHREVPHAAYLPELLPNGKYENPEQAVRNSANNGAVTGEDFDKIHPLLSKLDNRIDAVAHHYRNKQV